ncbi:MAG: hypothetical protein KKA32_02500 [Actinobacteria bacterium]|nr:hypothetical protein [Actinomycetota bacterium]
MADGGAVIHSLKPYPAMKDSGVPWLGEVPEHWEVRRLGDSVDGCINAVWGSELRAGHFLRAVVGFGPGSEYHGD